MRRLCPAGCVITISGRMTFTSNKSMEIEVLVDADPVVDNSQKRYRAASAFFTYVSLSQEGKSLPVPQLLVSGPLRPVCPWAWPLSPAGLGPFPGPRCLCLWTAEAGLRGQGESSPYALLARGEACCPGVLTPWADAPVGVRTLPELALPCPGPR